MTRRPPTAINVHSQRKMVRAWTDASGKLRLISAVVLIDNIFWYTFAYVNDKVWNQLQVRRDNQIGVQEMLAVVLLLETFDEAIRDSMMLLWIDNKGVLGSLRKGASTCMEMSLMVARCWMKCAECNVDMHTWYVASKSNVADGPSRDDVSDMVRLNATFVKAKLPVWLDTLKDAPTCPESEVSGFLGR